MIRNVRKFNVSEADYFDFINNYSGDLFLEGEKVKKKKKSSLLSNKNLRLELSYDDEKKSATIKYELKSNENDEVEIHYLKKGIENKLIQKIKKNTQFQKKNVLQTILLFALTITIVALAFNYLFSDWEVIKEGISTAFINANGFTTFIFLKFVTSPAISSIAFLFVYKFIFKKDGVRYIDLHFGYTVAFFLDQISPFWGPGLIFVTWFINRRSDEVRLADLAMTSLVYGTLVNTFAMFSTFILIPISQVILAPLVVNQAEFQVLVGLAWGGSGFFALNVVFYLMLGFLTWFQKFMVWLLVLAMKLVGLSKHTEKIGNDMMFQGMRLKKAYLFSFSHPLLLPGVALIWLFSLSHSWILFYSSVHTVAPMSSFRMVDGIAITSLVNSANSFIPIPGKAGITETFFIQMLNITTGDAIIAEKSTIVQRMFMNYWPMIIGGLAYMGTGLFLRKGMK